MRKAIQTPKPVEFEQFLLSKIRDLEFRCTEITLGTLNDGIWQECRAGEAWNTVRVGSVWDEPNYITLDELRREHAFIVEQFEMRMNKILGY